MVLITVPLLSTPQARLALHYRKGVLAFENTKTSNNERDQVHRISYIVFGHFFVDVPIVLYLMLFMAWPTSGHGTHLYEKYGPRIRCLLR